MLGQGASDTFRPSDKQCWASETSDQLLIKHYCRLMQQVKCYLVSHFTFASQLSFRLPVINWCSSMITTQCSVFSLRCWGNVSLAMWLLVLYCCCGVTFHVYKCFMNVLLAGCRCSYFHFRNNFPHPQQKQWNVKMNKLFMFVFMLHRKCMTDHQQVVSAVSDNSCYFPKPVFMATVHSDWPGVWLQFVCTNKCSTVTAFKERLSEKSALLSLPTNEATWNNFKHLLLCQVQTAQYHHDNSPTQQMWGIRNENGHRVWQLMVLSCVVYHGGRQWHYICDASQMSLQKD